MVLTMLVVKTIGLLKIRGTAAGETKVISGWLKINQINVVFQLMQHFHSCKRMN